MWETAFAALRLKDNNAWRMMPDEDNAHNQRVVTTFISVVRMTTDDNMIRRLIHSYPSFTSDALVNLANALRVEVVKMRLD